MLSNLLTGLAILKPGPNIVFEAFFGVVCTYSEYVDSLDMAWLEHNGWTFDHDNANWYFSLQALQAEDRIEFERRAKELVNSFKALDLNW